MKTDGVVWLALVFVFAAKLCAAQVAERPAGLGPFEELREPRFVPAAAASFLQDDDRVLGVSANGVARAYLAHVTAWHHIIDDQLGAMPILATW